MLKMLTIDPLTFKLWPKVDQLFLYKSNTKSILNFKLLHLTIMTVVQLENKNCQH